MKNIILKIKAAIRFFVSVITSREWAFVYCVAGTVAQISHTYFLVNSISSLEGGWKTFQAVALSAFISSSLLFFVAISDNEDTDESRKIHRTVTLFTIIEIAINTYYYSRHILIDLLALNKQPNLVGYFDFAFALIISVMIPITIKLYASNIRAKEWIEDIEHGRDATVSTDLRGNMDDHRFFAPPNGDEAIQYNGQHFRPDGYAVSITDDEIERVTKPLIEAYNKELLALQKRDVEIDESIIKELVEKVLNEKMTLFDDQLSKAFQRNSDLFIKQFENKVKLITTNGISSLTKDK